jgi:hypothetical protein
MAKRGRTLVAAISKSIPEILSFLPIYLIVMMGYAFAGHFLYGLRLEEWTDVGSAFFRVYEINFGLYDTNRLAELGGWVSSVYIYSITILLVIIMLNVFLSIVMNTWASLVEEEVQEMNSRREELKFLKHRDERILSRIKAFILVTQMSYSDLSYAVKMADELDPSEPVVVKEFEGKLATGIKDSKIRMAIISWFTQSIDEKVQSKTSNLVQSIKGNPTLDSRV